MTKQRTIEVKMKVAFHDLDATQVVWHGNYFKYFNVARFALLDEAGIDLHEFYKANQYLFPIVKTSTKHILPLTLNDEFIFKATVIESRIKLTMDFEIRLMKDGRICAKARIDQVAVKMPDMEMQLELPKDIRRALENSES